MPLELLIRILSLQPGEELVVPIRVELGEAGGFEVEATTIVIRRKTPETTRSRG